ncbi:integrase-like protein [Chitinophaga dinghuensis]|uniref:Integrase-like protein n=1 Tax=Chitinophaga dinghuensis TaxID=1539050 RepID=A0A327VPT7_9BACT|nr:tyrosine-type recombinase/integrase [Chitinophaga dinghuensis]RAJ77251.1 integrase-like protein [Chitinophaga dinghuensis]
MLLPTKLVCRVNKIRRDGTSVIFILYSGKKEKQILLNTGKAIPPKYWNHKFNRISPTLPSIYGNPQELNKYVTNCQNIANKILEFAIEHQINDIPKFVKGIYKPDFDLELLPFMAKQLDEDDPHKNFNLNFQMEEYIKSKLGSVSPRMITNYRNMRDIFISYETFCGQIHTYKDIHYSFYTKFLRFLTYEYVQRRRSDYVDNVKQPIRGLRTSTIGKVIKHFRMFVKNRIAHKYFPPIDLSKFTSPDEESDAIYLTPDEIKKIYQTDLSTYPELMVDRDMLVLGCLTGLRISDFASIDCVEDIRNNSIFKKQQKTDKWVVIPLLGIAKEIVDRYKSQFPKLSEPIFNLNIKTIGSLAGICDTIKFSYKKGTKKIVQVKPKYGWITSHTCRRSFCTNEFLASTPVELIMNISGHKSHRDFFRYIRVTPMEAAEKIKVLWESRSEQNKGA